MVVLRTRALPSIGMTFRRAVGYGIGDFGFNLFFTGLNLYLLFYYTDVLGIPAATAGGIFAISVFWDAISDPLMGWIATRTRRRLGGFRPYILFGAPLMSFAFVGMFAAPLWFPEAVVLVSAISHLVFRTAYTIVSIPFTALSSVLTLDSRERGTLAGARMVFAILGGLMTAALTLPLATYFGGGDLKAGFVRVACLYGVIAFALMLIVFFSTREDPRLAAVQTPVPLKRSIKMLRSNSAFWLLFAAIFALSTGAGAASKALVYYISYVVGAPESVSIVLSSGLLAAAISVPVWATIARRLDKKWVWIAGVCIHAGAMMALLVTGPKTVSALLPLHVMSGFGYGAFAVMLWSMLPDTVEWGEVYGSVRDEGLLFGLNQLSLKAASALAVAGLGFALSAIGYEANTAQSEMTMKGLRYLSFGVPILGGLISLSIIAFYPIGHDRHAALLRERVRA